MQCDDANPLNPYRKYVEKYLKTRGLRKTMSTLNRLIRGPLRRAKIALERPAAATATAAAPSPFTPPHLAEERFSSHPTPSEDEKELSRFGTWNEHFQQMRLPSFRAPYLFLCR